MYSDNSKPGVLGIKVKIMLPWDPSGKTGPRRPLPDHVSIVEPKEEPPILQPYSEAKGKPTDAAAAPPVMGTPAIAPITQ
ncbi:40S ribosomal protein s3 [Plakobranchus ocellatus]|uniref:40S ribosomal protein s3 n=1 Tax=Plakobranchus ocellatus TaxID=259542 RepID=A0AAV4DTK8_9GAST|nr:40S ribosomal protein s3 [Plakobranchus ocellatus]